MNPSQFIYEEKLKSLFYNIINEDEFIDKFRKELFSLENFSPEEIYKKNRYISKNIYKFIRYFIFIFNNS